MSLVSVIQKEIGPLSTGDSFQVRMPMTPDESIDGLPYFTVRRVSQGTYLDIVRYAVHEHTLGASISRYLFLHDEKKTVWWTPTLTGATDAALTRVSSLGRRLSQLYDVPFTDKTGADIDAFLQRVHGETFDTFRTLLRR